MQGWDTFAVVSGGAAAALLGLLFVAVSLRVDVIAASPELRNRAAQTLTLFLTPVLVALTMGLPGQSDLAAGIEFLAIAVVVALAFVLLDVRAGRRHPDAGVSRTLDIAAPRTITCVALAIGAVLVTFAVAFGPYLVALASSIAIVGGVVSAWIFLTRIGAR